jgi:hypothetical protein
MMIMSMRINYGTWTKLTLGINGEKVAWVLKCKGEIILNNLFR